MSEDTSNVILFPKQTVRPLPKQISRSKLIEKASTMKIEFYNEMADDMIDTIVRQISALDLNDMIDEDTPGVLNEMDVIIIREAIVSLMCRLTNINHPLQPLLKDLMTVKEVLGEDGDVIFTYTLKGSKVKSSS